jgi:hypothetical protein
VAEAIIAVVMHFTDPVVGRSRRLAELIDVFLDGLRPR